MAMNDSLQCINCCFIKRDYLSKGHLYGKKVVVDLMDAF